MAIRTQVIFAGSSTLAAGANVLDTCATDRVAIVKEVAASITGAGGGVFLGTRRSGVFVTALEGNSVDAANPRSVAYRVLEENDELVAFGPVGAVLSWWLSGSLLSGDAS